MITYFSFDVPKEKESINSSIKKFVNSYTKIYDYKETKDGFGYSIEFNSEEEKNKFKYAFEKKFPNLYL